jgi:hypothetical protein
MAVLFSGIAGCSKNQAPPTDAETPSNPQTSADPALSLWQRDIEQYRLHTKDPESVRPQAEEFMRAVQLNMLPNPRGPRLDSTVAMGDALFQHGCRDPLVKTYFGKALANNHQLYYAMLATTDGLNAWGQCDYLITCRRLGVFTIFGDVKCYAKGLPWSHARKEAVQQVVLRAADPTIGPEMRRVLFYELLPLVDDDCGNNWEDSVAISEAYGKQPKADPWITHLLAGRAFVATAWHHRGGKQARDVTPEARNLFTENLQKAAHEYAEALKLHPEDPEAASLMIPVAMMQAGDQTPQQWFDKAVAAQIDYMPAYRLMLWALRPRWSGSHEAMYRFGCRCADTKRYDTDIPFVLINALNDIDAELDYSGAFWRQKGVYARAKQVLEAMAQDPSRADDSVALAGKSRLQTIQAIVADRAGQYADARRLVDELGKRLDRDALFGWCNSPERELTRIYAFSGPAAGDLDKAWDTLMTAPKPISQKALQQVKGLYQKALKADDNERSKAFAQAWLDEIDGRLAFGEGNWYEKKFDPYLLTWSTSNTLWSVESARSATGRPRQTNAPVLIRPIFTPILPLEVEFDVELPALAPFPVELGLSIPRQENADPGEERKNDRFFVRTSDQRAGIEIGGKTKTVSCELKPTNRLRVQLADGRAAFYVNNKLCLAHRDKNFHPLPGFSFGSQTYLYPNMSVRVGNVRFRRWEPSKDQPSSTSALPDSKASKEEPQTGKRERKPTEKQ